MKLFIMLGSISALFGVALGAFGAHGLKSRVAPEQLTIWQTGVQYHLVHAIALVLVGILCQVLAPTPLLRGAGWSFLTGTVLFSGSLYLLVLSGVRSMGAITPFGGLAFLLGWLLLALAALRWPN